MRFAISAALFSLALAALGAAVPTANHPTEIVEKRSPSKYDDKDWDGKVIPLEEFGEVVTVSDTHFLLSSNGIYCHVANTCESIQETDSDISKRTLGMVYICPA